MERIIWRQGVKKERERQSIYVLYKVHIIYYLIDKRQTICYIPVFDS